MSILLNPHRLMLIKNASTRNKIWGKSLYQLNSTRRYSNDDTSKPVAKEFESNDIKVSYTDKFTTFAFLNDGKTFSYHNAFLRDSSQSATSIDSSSGQKLFTTASVLDVFPSEIEISDSSLIKIKWSDGDVSEISKNFLIKHSTSKKRQQGRYFDQDIVTWDSKQPEKKFPNILLNQRHAAHEEDVDHVTSSITHEHEEYLTKDKVLSEVLDDLTKFGISLITNIPLKPSGEQDSVVTIGERIGYIKRTFYGTTFDVKSKPNAKNLAYTDKFLPLHQDLLYYESPPGLQLLHFIKNESTGGENIFVDGFAAARHVKNADPEAYFALLDVPINYHYNNPTTGHHYFHSRRLIVEDDSIHDPHNIIYSSKDHFKEVNYSPPFQAPFDFGITTHLHDPEGLKSTKGKTENSIVSDASHGNEFKELGDRHIFEDFLRGLNLFESFINDPVNRLEFKVEEGNCVVFDNRRILHARNSFDSSSGERWLKGCYLDRDSFLSKQRVVREHYTNNGNGNIKNVDVD